MKKCVSIVVVGMIIICGITVGALPLNYVDTFVEKTPQTSYQLPTNTTNLTIIIKGGIGVTVLVMNTGNSNAINVTTKIDIDNGPFHLFGVESSSSYFGQLLPETRYRQRILDIGLGTVTVNVTASADNAAQVTKTAEGIILLFFIILK